MTTSEGTPDAGLAGTGARIPAGRSTGQVPQQGSDLDGRGAVRDQQGRTGMPDLMGSARLEAGRLLQLHRENNGAVQIFVGNAPRRPQRHSWDRA